MISIPTASGNSEVYNSQSEDCVVILIGYISIALLWCIVCPDFDFGENIIYEEFYRKNYIEMILTGIKCK